MMAHLTCHIQWSCVDLVRIEGAKQIIHFSHMYNHLQIDV